MRQRFNDRFPLFQSRIEEVVISHKYRDALPKLLKAIQHLYQNKPLLNQVMDILDQKINGGKQQTGRRGMSLWEIFVMAQIRHGVNFSYDRIHYLANSDDRVRGILGVSTSKFGLDEDAMYDYQNIYDNVTLLDDETVMKINDVIVDMGHEVFKKKEAEALRIKVDTFVVESNVHFPTDYNLLWDSARKCMDCIRHFQKNYPQIGWRKYLSWSKKIKNAMRQVGKISKAGGQNKEQRLQQVTERYLNLANRLIEKLKKSISRLPIQTMMDLATVDQLGYYFDMLNKHVDLVDRRIMQGEKIPSAEKIYSIFEPYTDFIKKGKSRPNVELGKKVSVSTDQFGLILHHKVWDHVADSTMSIEIATALKQNYRINSLSFDKGFWNTDNKKLLELSIPTVIMPKRGKRNKEQKEFESTKEFKKLKNAHQAVESNINELEHRSLNRCPDRGKKNFLRYCAMGVCAYNLHKIGAQIFKQKLKAEQKAKAKSLTKAA